MENQIKIQLIKTDSVCFISDCLATSGYDYNYHRSKIVDLFFDGEKPKPTYCKNWYEINMYPTTIQKSVTGEITNERYEIKNEALISEPLPRTMTIEKASKLDEEIIDSLYERKYDRLSDTLADVEVDFVEIIEVDNYKKPAVMEYNAVRRWDFSDQQYTISNANVQHQMLDEMIFPEILLSQRPSSFTSKQVYDMTRQYVKDNIDCSKATITSDYDFCFTVKKIIPLLEPKTISYHDVFAKTKKARNKLHFATKSYKEVEIFEMTHSQSNYGSYTAIPAMFGESEDDLKEKMDLWLKELIERINAPLELCECCNGTGYKGENAKILV